MTLWTTIVLAVDEKGLRVCMRVVFSRVLGMARENMKDGFEVGVGGGEGGVII